MNDYGYCFRETLEKVKCKNNNRKYTVHFRRNVSEYISHKEYNTMPVLVTHVGQRIRT